MKKILFFLFLISSNAFALTFSQRVDALYKARRAAKMKNRKNTTTHSAKIIKEITENPERIVETVEKDLKGMSPYQEDNKHPSLHSLKTIIEEGKGIKSTRKVQEYKEGYFEIVNYVVETNDGNVIKIEMKYLKPTVNGGMELMEFNIER